MSNSSHDEGKQHGLWPKTRHVTQKTDENVRDNILRNEKEIDTSEKESSSTRELNKVTRETTEMKQDTEAKEVKPGDSGGDPTESPKNVKEKKHSRRHFRRCLDFYIPKRYVTTFLMGFGMLLVYAMRTNVGVTVVMILDERAHEKVGTIDALMRLPRVPWDSRMIGFLHSVFYIGYISTQIPGAFFTTMWPSHKLFGACILISSLLNLLLPMCIENGEYSLTCVVRCCQGLSEGLLYPSCYASLRHWSAPSERSRVVAGVLTCAYAGAILGFPVAGLVTHYLGWHFVFYIFGGLSAVWYLCWLCLAFEKPSHHTSISDSEFEFMTKSQGQDIIDYENVPMPWNDILTSLPVIAICFCHFVRHWVFILMLTNEPLYLNEFGFTIAETGIYASLPHIAKVVLSIVSGCIADSLLNKKTLSTTAVRKLLTGFGLGFPAVFFIILTFLDKGLYVIIVLTLALGAFGISTSGWSVNHYDLSTRHASSLVAVTSTFGTVGAIIVPLAVGELTAKQDLESWNDVFYLTAAIVAFAVIFYLIFGSGNQQDWANPPAHINLIQKTDPLARKPYKAYTVQKPEYADKSGNALTDKTLLIQEKTGHGYGTNADNLQKQLHSKLDGSTDS